MRRGLLLSFGLIVAALLIAAACSSDDQTPASTVTPVPTSAPLPTPIVIPTPTLTPAPPPTPPATPITPTHTPTPHPGAALPELVKVADLPGGDIVDIEFVLSSPNVVYLASEPNAMGIWRSDDAGETWRQVSADYGEGGPAHIHDMAVHPDNPDVVLVADAHSLIKIVVAERDVEWTIVYPPTTDENPEQAVTVFAVGFSPSMPGVAYAVDGLGNILKSHDGGDTWQAVGWLEVGFGVSLVVDPGDPDTLYVGTGTGVFKSTDGGQNWQQVLPEGGMNLAIAPGAPDSVFAAGDSGIFKSTDDGETWRRTMDRHANSVQVAPGSPRVVYAGTPEGVLKSSDGGETWVNRNLGIGYSSVGALAVHPGEQNTVIAGSSPGELNSIQGEGIYKTIDGGLSWVRKGSEFIDVDVVQVAVDPSNPNVVYAGTRCSRGVYRTDDGGASWAFLSQGPRWAAHYTMRIATAAGSIVWLTGADGLEGSNDGGQTWPLAADELERHFHGIAISPHDSRLIFAGTAGDAPPGTTYYPGARILRSTDGGRSWDEVGSGFPSGADTNIHDIIFDPFDPKVVYVATTSHEASITVGIYKSTDGGETWMPANNGLAEDLGSMDVHEIVASPTTPGLLYAGTRAGVYRSTDGGGSWASTGFSEGVRSLLIDPTDPSSLYAGTDAGLFWSADGGDAWQRLESVPAKPVTGLAMDALGKALYAAVNRVGIFKGVKG